MNRELLIANALVVSSKSCTPADIMVSEPLFSHLKP